MNWRRLGWIALWLIGLTALRLHGAEATIEGMEIARANGGFLGLAITNNNFVLTFYNAKKEKVAPDAALATVRWVVRYQPNDERTVLNPGGDGFSLTSTRTVKPPHSFKLFLSLFAEGSETALESYTLDYRE